MGDESPLVFTLQRQGRGRKREMEIERDSRCCEALPSHCLSSLCLIGLPPPSPPHVLPHPSHPPLPAVTRAMGRQPRRLLVQPLLLLLSTLSSSSSYPPPPTSPQFHSPLPSSGLAEAGMRKPTRREGREARRRSDRF